MRTKQFSIWHFEHVKTIHLKLTKIKMKGSALSLRNLTLFLKFKEQH